MTGFLQTMKGLFFPEREEGRDPITRYLLLTLLAAAIFAALAYWFYNRSHTFDSYKVVRSSPLTDVEGTQYQMLSGRLIKFGHDGVSCVNLKNEELWSTSYTMSAPISDVSGNMMVIAEQLGKQVYVLNAKGILGSFTTELPVMKARISSAGVVALVLGDEDNTAWISLRSASGEQIASVKATQEESGYPMDIAISENARRLLVAYLGVKGAELTGKVALYDFSSPDDPDESHQLAVKEYPGTIFPEVFFAGANPVAVADDGFIAYTTGSRLDEQARLTLTDDILSVFHDAKSIGFVFKSGRSDVKYRMSAYNYRAGSTMEAYFDFDYDAVYMDGDEILLHSSSGLQVYRTSGRQKLSTAYERPVRAFVNLSGLRNYLVIASGSIDRIRIY